MKTTKKTYFLVLTVLVLGLCLAKPAKKIVSGYFDYCYRNNEVNTQLNKQAIEHEKDTWYEQYHVISHSGGDKQLYLYRLFGSVESFI